MGQGDGARDRERAMSAFPPEDDALWELDPSAVPVDQLVGAAEIDQRLGSSGAALSMIGGVGSRLPSAGGDAPRRSRVGVAGTWRRGPMRRDARSWRRGRCPRRVPVKSWDCLTRLPTMRSARPTARYVRYSTLIASSRHRQRFWPKRCGECKRSTGHTRSCAASPERWCITTQMDGPISTEEGYLRSCSTGKYRTVGTARSWR